MTDEARHSISGVLLTQYQHAWDMLTEILPRFSVEHWRLDVAHGLAPARVAYHLVETAEFYLSDAPAEFTWGWRFGGDWDTAAPESLPTQEKVLEYLADVRSVCENRLRDSGGPAMLDPDPVYGGEGMSRLDLYLYLLRHTHHHIGELCARLRSCGLPRPQWR